MSTSCVTEGTDTLQKLKNIPLNKCKLFFFHFAFPLQSSWLLFFFSLFLFKFFSFFYSPFYNTTNTTTTTTTTTTITTTNDTTTKPATILLLIFFSFNIFPLFFHPSSCFHPFLVCIVLILFLFVLFSLLFPLFGFFTPLCKKPINSFPYTVLWFSVIHQLYIFRKFRPSILISSIFNYNKTIWLEI